MRDADRERERRQRSRVWTPSRPEVIERLDAEGLLPAITFIFSRAACEAAVQQCLYAGLRLNDDDARVRVRELVEERTASIPTEDLHVLGYYEFLEGLERGIASHHAGMLPTFKEVVEELFVRGLVKAVFATETLALGINMPARSVVLEKLVKWNGEQHADITPGEYTQLTGRAGRRGIDVEGHAVVLWQRGISPDHLAGLAGTRTYPLRSSFKPSYNMAVNLVEQFGRHRSRELLETSFAQFQADKSVVGISRQVQRNEEGLDGYKESMTCHLGDFEEYMTLRRELKDRETELAKQGAAQRRAEAAVALEKLKPGDVIHVPTGKYAGLALVLDPGLPAGRSNGHRGFEQHDGPRPLVLTAERQVKRLASMDFPVPVEALERMRIPKSFNARSPQSRRDLASALRTKAGHIVADRHRKKRAEAADDREIARLRTAIRAHPCHGCNDREDHARWAERYHRLLRDTSQLERRIEGRTNTIARTFDRIVALLTELDYLRGNEVTEHGKRLARLYGELDLLASECLRAGVWEGARARPNSPPASRRWCTSRGSPTMRWRRRCRRARRRPRWARWCGSGVGWMPLRRTSGSPRPRGSGSASRISGLPGPRTSGLPVRGSTRCCARRRCPRGTLCGGASRSSMCWGRSRPPRLFPGRRTRRSRRTRVRRWMGCCGGWWRTRRSGDRLGGGAGGRRWVGGAGGWGSRGVFRPLRPYPSRPSGAPPQAPPGGAAPWTPARGCAPWILDPRQGLRPLDPR